MYVDALCSPPPATVVTVLRKVSRRSLETVIFINIFLPTPNRVTEARTLLSHSLFPRIHTDKTPGDLVNRFYFCQVELESPFCIQ